MSAVIVTHFLFCSVDTFINHITRLVAVCQSSSLPDVCELYLVGYNAAMLTWYRNWWLDIFVKVFKKYSNVHVSLFHHVLLRFIVSYLNCQNLADAVLSHFSSRHVKSWYCIHYEMTLYNVWLAVFDSCVCRWVFPLKSLCAVLWLQTMFSCSSQLIQHFRHLSARTTTCACVTVSRMCHTCHDRLMVQYLLHRIVVVYDIFYSFPVWVPASM